jgi:hypothetical protein
MPGRVPSHRIAVAAILACLALPAGAGAATFCVVHSGSCPSGELPEGSVQAALTAAAAATPGPNVVQLGAGTYSASGSGFDYSTPGAPPVSVLGAGSGQTILNSSSGAPFVLRLGIAGSSVSDLSIALVPPSTAGLVLGADGVAARRVSVTGTGALGAADGVQLTGAATFADGAVTLPDASRAAVEQLSGTGGTVSGSQLSAGVGLLDTATAHATLAARDVVIHAAQNAASVGASDTLTLDGALVLMHGAAPVALTTTDGTLTVHSATILGLNGAGFGGSIVGNNHGTGTLAVQDSILRGFGFSFSLQTAGTGSAANLTAEYDDLHLTTGTGSVPGTVTLDHNIDIDPSFVNAAAGDYHLLAGSPAIDAGGPCDATCVSIPDLDGGRVPVDGDGDGVTTRDLGAYEYGHRAPTAEPSASDGIEARSPVPFDGSASVDPDDGDQLSYAWTFDDGATAAGVHVQHAFATAGLHSATLTVTDPTGLSSVGTVLFTVGPAPVTPTPVPHRTPPTVAGLTLSPASFAVGARVTAIAARAHAPKPAVGTTIRFTLSETSKVAITIQRVISGHESHNRCSATARHGKGCSLVSTVGVLKRAAVPGGPVRIVFSGRIARRALARGSYVATVVATDTVGDVSRAASTRFTIVAA